MNASAPNGSWVNSDYIPDLSEYSRARLSRPDLSHEGKVMAILKQIQAVVLSFTITMTVIPGYAASREASLARKPTSAIAPLPLSHGEVLRRGCTSFASAVGRVAPGQEALAEMGDSAQANGHDYFKIESRTTV
jgi:hypothetical protein